MGQREIILFYYSVILVFSGAISKFATIPFLSLLRHKVHVSPKLIHCHVYEEHIYIYAAVKTVCFVVISL
jgi:hypothetical protein